MLRMMSDKDAISVIMKSLTTGGDGYNMEGDYHYPPSITLRVGGQVKAALTYDVDIDTLTIIAAYETDRTVSPDEWEGFEDAVVVFKMACGYYGLAFHTNWWSPTFGGDDYSLDITESDEWELFYNFSLSSSDREVIDAFINPTVGLTSSNPDVRVLAEEINRGSK